MFRFVSGFQNKAALGVLRIWNKRGRQQRGLEGVFVLVEQNEAVPLVIPFGLVLVMIFEGWCR